MARHGDEFASWPHWNCVYNNNQAPAWQGWLAGLRQPACGSAGVAERVAGWVAELCGTLRTQ